MIANGPIAGHPIAALLLRRGGDAPEVVEDEITRGGGGMPGPGLYSRIMRDDEDILAVIMAFTLRGRR